MRWRSHRRATVRSTTLNFASSLGVSAKRHLHLVSSILRDSTEGLFIPVSELNRLRQEATEDLELRASWAATGSHDERAKRVRDAIDEIAQRVSLPVESRDPIAASLIVEVFDLDDARAAARSGATEVILDPFLRHPTAACHPRLEARG